MVAIQGSAAASSCVYLSGLSQELFGRYDTALQVLSAVIAILVSMRFTQTQFELPRPSRGWTAFGVLVFLAVAADATARGGPFSAVRALALPLTVVGGGGVAQIVTVARLALRGDGPLNASVVLAAWIVLGTFSTPELASWIGLGGWLGGVHIGGIGVAGFAVLQFFALSRDFIRSLGETDRLNVALEGKIGRLAEQTSIVAQLNDELRRQVLARSEQLSDALTRLAGAQGEPVVLKENDVVEGRYTIVRLIGAGGMGVVYEVRRTSDDARLALKVLSGAAGVREMARFAREAKLAAAVRHPNVVQIVDVAISSGFSFSCWSSSTESRSRSACSATGTWPGRCGCSWVSPRVCRQSTRRNRSSRSSIMDGGERYAGSPRAAARGGACRRPGRAP